MTSWIEFGSRRKTALLLIGGIAISGLLLWFALRDVSYDQFIDAFHGAQWGWLPVALAIMLFSIYLRAVRWRLLFNDPEQVSMRLSFAAVNVGGLFNNILPQRMGEVTRVVAVNRASGISRLETTATIVAERMMDVFATGVIGLAFWPFFPDTRWVTVVEIICIVAVAAPVLVIALLSGFRAHVPGLVRGMLKKVPRLGHDRAHQFTDSLAAGGRVLLKPHRMLPAIGLSFAAWGTAGAANWALFQMFDFNIDAVPAMALVLVAVNFAVAIPAAPGSVGVFEAAAQASLVAFGLNASDALSFAVVAHLMTFFPVILLGIGGLVTVERMNRVRQASWVNPDEVAESTPT